ncbi:hypothetical protein PlfCFBP13513_14995 [Plantibacter flavus]|nr:hypothetical protein PlfCFBP13513_14995 [Plantibacter flavus]
MRGAVVQRMRLMRMVPAIAVVATAAARAPLVAMRVVRIPPARIPMNAPSCAQCPVPGRCHWAVNVSDAG